MKSYPGGIRHDYKDLSSPAAEAKARHWSLFAVGLLLPVAAVLVFVSSRPDPTMAPPAPKSQTPTVSAVPEPPTPAPSTLHSENTATSADGQTSIAALDSSVLSLTIEAGDTLDAIFRRHDLSLTDLAAMASLPNAKGPLRLLKPGDDIEITHQGSRVLSLTRELDDINMLSIERKGSSFDSSIVSRDVDIRIAGAHNTIHSSLFLAGREAGLSDAVIMEMVGIFDWDIDFLQDVRANDQFTILYEEWWRDGVKLRNGRIVAAEFVNRGKVFRAARYTDDTGHADYYTPDGHSIRKAFIRNPVALGFTRVSDSFNPNRKHPVLNTIRAHRGVDYAAPTGTPIKAAGDGKVIFRGRNGSFGNTVILEHGGNITTLYAHMSRFAAPRVGSRVKQGDIIGYVGQTGLATGPHLHYEYRVNGVHRNPETVTLPPAEPIPVKYQRDFEATTASIWNQLDFYKRAWLTADAH